MTEKFNPAFAGYATRVAFNLNITRQMIIALREVEVYGPGHWTGTERSKIREEYGPIGIHNPDRFVPAARGLVEKGLVEYNNFYKTYKFGDPIPKSERWVYRLTPAGEHVMALLRIAGLVPQAKLRVVNE